MAVTPDGALVFVVQPARRQRPVTMLDAQALAVVGTALPVGNRSTGIAVTPDGTRVFVANLEDNTVTVLVPSVTGGTGA